MPTSVEALAIIALVLAPGFICVWCARQSIKQVTRQSDLEFLISVVATGVWMHVLLFPFPGRRILSYYRNETLPQHEWWAFAWAVVLIFALPTAVGLGIGYVISRGGPSGLWRALGLDYVSRTPHAWDYSMRRDIGCYLRVFLKGESGVIGGTFGAVSFASSDRERPDLFLERVWHLNDRGEFLYPVRGNIGVWISPDLISRVEFVEGKENFNGLEQTGASTVETTAASARPA